MRNIKIVADSSANLHRLDTVPFSNAPMKLRDMIAAEMPQVSVKIGINRVLCSYYAEKGGLLVGFEKR